MWTHDILSPLSSVLPHPPSSSSPSLHTLSTLHLSHSSFLFYSSIIHILYRLMDEKSPLSFFLKSFLFNFLPALSSVLDFPLSFFALKFNSSALLSVLNLSNYHNLFSSSCYQTLNSSLSFKFCPLLFSP
jgi:cytochrome c oxidase assembly factor CtaG